MRTGAFWDFVEGRSEPPPIATLLGFELRDVDPEAMTIEVGFTAFLAGELSDPDGRVVATAVATATIRRTT